MFHEHSVSFRVGTVKQRIALLAFALALLSSAQLTSSRPLRAFHGSSTAVGLVPNARGRATSAGTLPTTGFSDGYSPTFVDEALQTLPAHINSYDTVVLREVCDISVHLQDPSWKGPVESWIQAGGKLVIYDSDGCGGNVVDYSQFALPFSTENPCQCGSHSGTLSIVEENTLSSANVASPYYIDTAAIVAGTDAVGDASVMTAIDPSWKGDLQAHSPLTVRGLAAAPAQGPSCRGDTGRRLHAIDARIGRNVS